MNKVLEISNSLHITFGISFYTFVILELVILEFDSGAPGVTAIFRLAFGPVWFAVYRISQAQEEGQYE